MSSTTGAVPNVADCHEDYLLAIRSRFEKTSVLAIFLHYSYLPITYLFLPIDRGLGQYEECRRLETNIACAVMLGKTSYVLLLVLQNAYREPSFGHTYHARLLTSRLSACQRGGVCFATT